MKSFTLSYEVSLDDLDMTSSAGLAAAEKRVNNAAVAACKGINRESTGTSTFDSLSPNDELCAKESARKAIVKLHRAIAAAAKAPNN
ncbi:MAG: UrcA family protein [Steroidobacteraceae bacterium]